MSTVPANLITGFLGVGKTTAILDLLNRKPAGERWAVLVNEYGEVGIDAAILEGGAGPGVTVKEVAGGCFCCTTAPFLPVALHFLLRDANPDRLLIEASGLGHPAKLVEMFRTNYADRLDLRATICVADPADFARPGMTANPVFVDQVQLADVLVLNKADTATPELTAAFADWANGLFPPKLLIAATTCGRLDPAWLDLTAADERPPLYPGGHVHAESRGRIFPPECVFDEGKLLGVIAAHPQFARLKGVFHCDDDWISVNRSGGTVTVAPTAYRRDSRVEVIAPGVAAEWPAFEVQLETCQVRGKPGA